MPTPTKKTSKKVKVGAGGHVIGRDRFAKISAIEGITLTDAMLERARTAAAKGLSAEEARQRIIRSYRKG